jgi:RHS repeat-associated protein
MYEYDEVGALIRVIHGRDVRDTTTYRYNTGNGGLDTLDFSAAGLTGSTWRYRFLFQYDALGRRRQINYPNGAVVTLRYDAAGKLRQVLSNRPGSPPAGSNADIYDFTLRQEQVNAAGLITREHMVCGGGIGYGNPCGETSPRTTTNQYNRLGMLVRQQINSDVDSMGYDASGNMVFRRDGATGTFHTFGFSSNPPSNRVITDGHFSMHYEYTPDGDRDLEYSAVSAYSTRFYYYDGLQRMTGAMNYANIDGFMQWVNNAQACLFDADGQMSKPCDNGAPRLAYDGHNMAATPIAGTNGPTWRIIHGPGTDDPLLGWWKMGLHKQVYYWITDGQGRHLAFADSIGWLGQQDYVVRYGQDGGKYAGGTSSATTFKADRFSTPLMPGLSFFRNRAYDQQTGRWTQEDPIGVAGGINLYQFNGNNPVMFTDPFGLCPQPPGSCVRQYASAFAAMGGTLGVAVGVLSGGVTVPVTTGTGIAVGGAVGAIIGAIVELTDGSSAEEDTPAPASKVTNPDGSPKEAGQQYEEITEAQRKNPDKIQSTKKSKQRDREEIRQEAEDALDRLRNNDY